MEVDERSKSSTHKRTRSEVEAEDASPKNGLGNIARQDGISFYLHAIPSRTHDTDMIIVDGSSSSDDDMGPQLPTAVPKKKRRVLPYEKLYISALPVTTRYSKSLMHRDQLSFVTITPFTDFLITSSVDGVVKFWKKVVDGVEFVKEFRAHSGEIKSVSVSADGRSFATAGMDKTLKIFDIITFGMRSRGRRRYDF